MTRRARFIEEERRLSIDLGDGACVLTGASKETVAEGTTKTILASYPGSGKKFTYAVIEGLTDHKSGDDWNFSALGPDTLHLKTSYPHKEGTWTWKDQFDQVILLIRNPRWALPSYHTMRFELDYSSNWAESYARIPFVYTSRPDVATWKGWRDLHFDEELDNWVNYVEFWMEDGLYPDGSFDAHCTSDMDCKPKAVIDFDRFYQEHPTTEFYKVDAILGGGTNVEMIAAQARTCILDAVFDKKLLHNANRNGNGPPQSSKTFSTEQLSEMLNRLSELRGKYAVAPHTENPIATELVKVLDEYNAQIGAEYEFQIDQTQTA
eukprot:CAMPEP_0197233934 /NCGR_PEP_ID=MMETSP1429-20130617/1836_1 /TAXON_ID=49237 /ORGANISM="Chaetoceros  sp., Strain UNC1202" /LENGTH=320 /DNA_ID=CAMNT_0042692251 /DNA_START=125 /DNA_END=1087 /DNA_ORIENTATION=+